MYKTVTAAKLPILKMPKYDICHFLHIFNKI